MFLRLYKILSWIIREGRLSLPIEDDAIIGDCHTAALISKQGSIDWFCFPHFDSGACFAALLGTEDHGHWAIAPAEPIRSIRRRYRGDTLILETEFETENGSLVLIDCMTPRDEEPQVVRMVWGNRGQVRMKMDLVMRFDHGSGGPVDREERAWYYRHCGPRQMRGDAMFKPKGRACQSCGMPLSRDPKAEEPKQTTASPQNFAATVASTGSSLLWGSRLTR
jgi:hypothetical protein